MSALKDQDVENALQCIVNKIRESSDEDVRSILRQFAGNVASHTRHILKTNIKNMMDSHSSVPLSHSDEDMSIVIAKAYIFNEVSY